MECEFPHWMDVLYLRVMEKCVFVVDRASSRSTFPLSLKGTLIPCLLQTQQTSVHLRKEEREVKRDKGKERGKEKGEGGGRG